MPRKARLFVPGCVHHVMARGLDGIDIFVDDSDRQIFLELYRLYHQKTGVQCYAWALMSNHFHFVVRTSDVPLSKLFGPLNTRYARYFNKKYSRRGYLFQDRFKSLATQEQLYIESLVRYVHLNPVRAGVCKNLRELDHYPWTGHAVLMGHRNCEFQDCDAVLQRFGGIGDDARKKYQEFIESGVGRDNEDPMCEMFRTGTQGGADRTDHQKWVIGDPAFVREALGADQARRIRLARYAAEGQTIDSVCTKVAEYYRIQPYELRHRRARGECSKARKALAWICHKELDMPIRGIASWLNVGSTAVSMMMPEGEEYAREFPSA